MKVKIIPGKNEFKNIEIVSSKSIAHRYILAKYLSKSLQDINNIDISDDVLKTYSCVKNIKDNCVLDCNESGSTLRFLIPIISALGLNATFIGKKSLFKRPLSVYEDIYKKQNLIFNKSETSLYIKGKLKPDNFVLKGDISSQFITGLLFALPLLKEKSTIKIIPPFESKSYVDITIDVLSKFDIHIKKIDDYNYEIEGNQSYKDTNMNIEGDYSQMSFFACLGQINSKLSISNLSLESKQGDRKIIDIIKNLNGNIYYSNDKYISEKSNLKASLIDLKDTPDLGPIVIALCTQVDGISKIINVKRLRIKESDRIKSMEEELKKLGCNIEVYENEIIIKGKQDIKSNDILYGHNDHRIVMALSILSTISKNDVIIDNVEAINKSYPRFFDDLKSLGIKIEEV